MPIQFVGLQTATIATPEDDEFRALAPSQDDTMAAVALLTTVPTDRALAGWQPFSESHVQACMCSGADAMIFIQLMGAPGPG